MAHYRKKYFKHNIRYYNPIVAYLSKYVTDGGRESLEGKGSFLSLQASLLIIEVFATEEPSPCCTRVAPGKEKERQVIIWNRQKKKRVYPAMPGSSFL